MKNFNTPKIRKSPGAFMRMAFAAVAISLIAPEAAAVAGLDLAFLYRHGNGGYVRGQRVWTDSAGAVTTELTEVNEDNEGTGFTSSYQTDPGWTVGFNPLAAATTANNVGLSSRAWQGLSYAGLGRLEQHARGEAFNDDNMTISAPGRDGQYGIATFSVKVAGNLDVYGGGILASSTRALLFVLSYYEGPDNGYPTYPNGTFEQIFRSELLSNPGPAGGSTAARRRISEKLTKSYRFQFGIPFHIGWNLVSRADGSVTFPSAPDGRSAAEATLEWDGVKVTDLAGRPVSFTWSSAAGVPKK